MYVGQNQQLADVNQEMNSNVSYNHVFICFQVRAWNMFALKGFGSVEKFVLRKYNLSNIE